MTAATPFHAARTRPMHTPSSPCYDPVLDDAAFDAVAAALARVRPRVGRPFRDERRTIEAVLWRSRHDRCWRDIPESLGPWWRAAQLYYRWEKAGLWARLRHALREDGREDLADLFALTNAVAPGEG
jgi:transposase